MSERAKMTDQLLEYANELVSAKEALTCYALTFDELMAAADRKIIRRFERPNAAGGVVYMFIRSDLMMLARGLCGVEEVK